MFTELFSTMFAAFIKGFSEAFLSWMKEQQAQESLKEIGRQEVELKTDEMKKCIRESEQCKHPPDDGVAPHTAPSVEKASADWIGEHHKHVTGDEQCGREEAHR